MESNLKKSPLSKWSFNFLNLKRFNKPKEEKGVTKETENKRKISQSSKPHSNMINLLRKLSIRSEKNITSETARSGEGKKEQSKSKNFTIKTRHVNETENSHLNNKAADFVTEKMSNQKLNDVSTDRKKSTLHKCNNKIALDKKDFDNSEKAFHFDKNIKVEESEDRYSIAPNTAKSNSKYSYNDKVKSLNPSWIDGKNTKIGSTHKLSNNLGTISYNVNVEDSGKLLNTDSDVCCLGSKDIKIEEENQLDGKSEFTPVTFKECKFNHSDFRESSSKHSQYVGCRRDYKSVSNSDNNEGTPVEELDIIERGPKRNLQNKGTHRVNPSQKRVDQGKNVLCHSSVGSRIIVQRPTINSALDYIPVNNLNSAPLRVEDCYCNYVDSSNQYIENHVTQMGCSLFNQEQLYWNMGKCNTEDIAKRDADKIIDSYVEGYRRQELEHISSCLECNIKIIAQTEADQMIESYRQQDSEFMSLRNYDPDYFDVSEEIEKYIGIEMNKYIIKRQKDHFSTFEDVYDFSKANEVLASREAATPESECSSPGFQFSDFSNENEEGEKFCAEIKNYANNFFQGDNLVSNSCAPALEKSCSSSKKGYYNRIASKDQQNCNSELKMQARNKLISSAEFSKSKCREEYLEMYKQIRYNEFGTEGEGVIHNLKPKGEKKYRRTNLHAAVMEGNLEKAFCIIEIHKQYHGHITFGINIRDNKGKTVLDRAKENNSSLANDLLIQYLEENNAMPAIHHMIPISTPGT